MATRTSILIVDDQPALCDSLRLHSIDLILADIAMPRMDGYQLCEWVREHRQWMRIPFLFLSARTTEWEVRYGKSLGADEYLTKPIEPEDLLRCVHQQLDRAHKVEWRIANVALLDEALERG